MSKKGLFQELYNSYYKMVFQLCLGFVKGNRMVAADLCQDVFIAVWNALDGFKGASSYKTWIYRICTNTCLKSIRETKKQAQIPLGEQFDLSPYEDQNVENQNHQTLYNAIGELAEIDRIIIMLFLDGEDYPEISATLGISEGNLRVKLHRIKKRLKEIIENGK